MSAAVKEQILLVDDEPQVLIALEDLLSDEFVVHKASSGDAALRLLETVHNIAAVVTDQRMPRMNGDELLSRLGPLSDASRILVTGFADLSAVVRAVNEGRIFAYVTKPWNGDDLKTKVHLAVEHCRLARELDTERKLLRDLMESVPDGIYFKDEELRFIRANPAYAEQVGAADVDHLIGRRAEDVTQGPLRVRPTRADELRVLRDGIAVTDRVFAEEGAGRRRWFSKTIAPVRSGRGDVVGVVAVSRDVTDRIETQEALRQGEARLREQTALLSSILESMEEGVIVADGAGDILVFNPRAAAILGPRPLNLTAHNWPELYGALLNDQTTPLPTSLNPLLAAITGENLAGMEVCIRNEAVRDAMVAITAAPLADAQGRRAGGVLVLRDVTEQRSLQQMLTQSQKMEAIGRLAGGVAHDFNNLLVVIDSYGELLTRSLPEGDARRDDLAQMMEASKRAAALTKQLLAFGRRQMIQPRVLTLNDVVSNVDKMLRRVIGENIDLVLDLAPDLGSIRADAGQIDQIILNLTVNARDSMPEGGSLTISTFNAVVEPGRESPHSEATPGSYVVLSVSDTGIGMSAETQQRIFEPFFTTKGPERGTGLGLATVYGIVKQSCGHISVRSELRVGTTFLIHFPTVEHVPVEKHDSARASSQRPVQGTEVILLVEDDDAVRRVSSRILRAAGYRVLEARRPSDARAMCAREGHAVDLLLTDVVMPSTSGPKLVEELTGLFPQLRVLYMSGYTAEAIQSGDSTEGYAFLEKPFTPHTLLGKVREVMRDK